LTATQRALILALEAIRPSRSDLPDVEALFQAKLARVLADPACPFCTAEMRDGRCPGCGHDPSTRGS
jgi:hypothetical protein